MPRKEYKSISVAKNGTIKLSASQKRLLDEREKEALSGKISKKSWTEIKKSIIKAA